MLLKSVQLMQQMVLMNTVSGVCNASAVMGQDLSVLQVCGYSNGYSLPFLFALILLAGSGLLWPENFWSLAFLSSAVQWVWPSRTVCSWVLI